MLAVVRGASLIWGVLMGDDATSAVTRRTLEGQLFRGDVEPHFPFLGIQISVNFDTVKVIVDPEYREVSHTALPAPEHLPAINAPVRRPRVVEVPIVRGVRLDVV